MIRKQSFEHFVNGIDIEISIANLKRNRQTANILHSLFGKLINKLNPSVAVVAVVMYSA